MRRHLRRSRRKILSLRAWRARLVFWVGALLVGSVCALFAALSEQAHHWYRVGSALAPWMPLVITPLGLSAIAWATRRLFPGSQGSGIPQAIAALDMRGKAAVLSVRIAVGKILLTLGGLAAGASIGREGPSVHIGAAIMYSLGRVARFPPHYMERGLILAGGAAGIAAAFNTPLAGIVFAIEEMSRSFEQRTSGIVMTAVVFAGVTAMVVLGNYDYFGHSDAVIDTPSWMLAVPLCGAVGGLLGGLFASALLHSTRRLSLTARHHPYALAFICGLVVAGLGMLTAGQTNGTGYEVARGVITGGDQIDPLYPFYKVAATLASYLSGIPGGIFAPSLATGAGIGADLAYWVPLAPAAVMILLGMVAYFAGVVQAPITAFIIVMEMTDNQDMLLALIASAFIAQGASHLVCPIPLYSALAESFLARDGMRKS
jgi:H+/Cl- antiporter ClcA